MVYQSAEGRLPLEVLQEIRQNEATRDALYGALLLGRESVHRDQLPSLKVLERHSAVSIVPTGCNLFFMLTVQYQDPAMIRALSDAIVYAGMDEEQRRILDQSLDKRVKIDGFDGVLIAENGHVYHIGRCTDTGSDSPTGESILSIRAVDVPVTALRRNGKNLTIGGMEDAEYSRYLPTDSKYASLDRLLHSMGVTTAQLEVGYTFEFPLQKGIGLIFLD